MICKHFMYGYCKYQERCPEQHINVICEENTKCDNNGCVKRHPKPCKFFARNGKCKFERCAYMHVKDENILKIEDLEGQVHVLKENVDKLTKTNNDITNNETKLRNTLADIVERLKFLEQRHKEQDEIVNDSKESPGEITSEKNSKAKDVDNTTDETKTVNKTDDNFKCDQCNFKTNKINTLTKHTTTKHAIMISKECNSKCSLCEDRFQTDQEFKKHIAEHMEEIEVMDLASLTHGNDLFECNLCSFESGMGDSIREHLIDHVNSSLEEEITGKEVKSVQSEAKSLLDEYDDDGNYIGDNPKYMDNHDASESESEEEHEH